MKLLQNPFVTGALAVVALAVVGYQVFSSGPGRGRTSRAQPSAPAPVVPAPSAPAVPHSSGPIQSASSKEKAAAPSNGMDREYIALYLTKWVKSEGRDPFLLHRPPNQPVAGAAPSQVSKWKLRAIWRQTGSRVAAINNGIYKEGDVIEGHKIIRIEDDVVWFQNPDSLDHLEFAKRQGQPGGTNTISVETNTKN